MNNFSASIVLCEHSLQEFIDMPPQDRMNGFGGYIGVEPIVGLSSLKPSLSLTCLGADEL